MSRHLCLALAAVLACASLPAASLTVSSEAPHPARQSDLDAFMQRVLARRDENWKKLQQYILDEREQVQVRGPSSLPIWGDRREYTWFIRDGYFIRSPLKANGVTIQESERRKYEETYLRRMKEREKRDKQKAENAAGEAPPPERVPEEPPKDLDALLSQTRQPQFIDSAYFLKFKFEQGKYALVGRETFDTQEVLRIEYYPARLFSDDRKAKGGGQTPRAAETKPGRNRSKEMEETMERLMNKVSLVTLWIEPKSHQIVKYTFDNVNFDFLPAAWLLRVNDLQASMTMGQPIKDVKDLWLPRQVDWYFSAMLAIGSFDVRYHIDYHDYRQATARGRIKGAGEDRR